MNFRPNIIAGRTLDKSHASARGLWLALIPDGNGAICKDQANGYTAICDKGARVESGRFINPATNPGGIIVAHPGRGFTSGTDFTLIMGIYSPTDLTFGRFASQEGLGGTQIALYQISGIPSIEVLGSGTQVISAPAASVNARWHFALVRRGSSITAYTMGLSRGTFTGANSASSTSTCFLNRASDWNRGIAGECDSIFAWDRALTDDEVFRFALDPMYMMVNRRRTYSIPGSSAKPWLYRPSTSVVYGYGMVGAA
jgi:hypothetical protein